MRVLGVDPGLTRCGLGVVDSATPGARPSLVAVDVVRTPSGLETSRRLLRIDEVLDEWLVQHRPDVVCVERVFAQHNVSTVMGTAQASGVVMVAGARRSLPVVLHTPSEVKAAITGSGRAGKAQVGAMVARILGLASPPKPADAADALALAICHLWRGGPSDRLAGLQSGPSSNGYARAVAEARRTAAHTRTAPRTPTTPHTKTAGGHR